MESPGGTHPLERPVGGGGICVGLFMLWIQTALTVMFVDLSHVIGISSFHPDPAKLGDHVDSLLDPGKLLAGLHHHVDTLTPHTISGYNYRGPYRPDALHFWRHLSGHAILNAPRTVILLPTDSVIFIYFN